MYFYEVIQKEEEIGGFRIVGPLKGIHEVRLAGETLIEDGPSSYVQVVKERPVRAFKLSQIVASPVRLKSTEEGV